MSNILNGGRRTTITQHSSLCGRKRRGEKLRSVLLLPSINSPPFSSSIYRGVQPGQGEEGGAPRTSGACSGSTPSRASSWLISSSSTTSQGSWCSLPLPQVKFSCLISTFRSQLPSIPLLRRMLGTLVRQQDQRTTFMYASSSVMVARV